jgi:hypothetical protein
LLALAQAIHENAMEPEGGRSLLLLGWHFREV